MKVHKVRKAARESFRSYQEHNTKEPTAPEPVKNEALIARARGFRYNVPVAFETQPDTCIGKVIRVVIGQKSRNVSGSCRVLVNVRGREQSLKPSELVAYTAKAQG